MNSAAKSTIARGGQALRAITGLAITSLISGCSLLGSVNSFLEPAKVIPPSDQNIKAPDASSPSAVPSTRDQFARSAITAYAQSAGAMDFKVYASKGVNLSDQQCDEWLNILSHQNTEIEFGSGLFQHWQQYAHLDSRCCGRRFGCSERSWYR